MQDSQDFKFSKDLTSNQLIESCEQEVADEYFEIARILARIVVENHFDQIYQKGKNQ